MKDDVRKAANKLHHLSMLYAGALAELGQAKKLGLLPSDAPGIKGARDIVDIVLLVRAELNAVTNLLLKRGVIKLPDLEAAFAHEYEWFAQQKANLFGCKVTEGGLFFG